MLRDMRRIARPAAQFRSLGGIRAAGLVTTYNIIQSCTVALSRGPNVLRKGSKRARPTALPALNRAIRDIFTH